jgi:hypothetical protein
MELGAVTGPWRKLGLTFRLASIRPGASPVNQPFNSLRDADPYTELPRAWNLRGKLSRRIAEAHKAGGLPWAATSAYLRPTALAARPFALRGSAGECRSAGQRCSRPSAPARNGSGKRGEPILEQMWLVGVSPFASRNRRGRGEARCRCRCRGIRGWMPFGWYSGGHAAGRTVDNRLKQAARAA